MEKPEVAELMEDDPTTPTAEETPSSATQFQSATATPQRGYRQQGEVLHAPTSRVTYQLGGCIGNYEFVTSKVPEIGMKDPRRGVFAEQPADLKRTIAKWKTMMDLTPFDPQTERELEDWFDKNTPSIIANEASPSVVIRVLRLIATEPWHEYLDACLTKVGVFKYIADLADALAGEMFPGTGELIAFEREIMSLAECPTVKAAREKYKKLFETYRSMCSRRQRTGIWHVEQATQIALQLIPERYLAAIRTGTYMGTWTPMSIFAHAMQMEQNTADLAAVRPEKVFQVGEDENMEELLPPPKKAKIAPTAKGPPCVRCAESGHLKKDCPFKLYQCFNCGKVGHIARACKQQIIRDSAGRPRLLARAKQTGIAMETRIDRTTPEQLKTVAAVAGNLIERREPAKKKAREKYAKKKFAKTGKEVVPRPTKREVLIAEATGEASSSSQVPAEQEEEESSDDLAEPQLSYTVFTVSNRPNKLLKIRAYINNTLTVVSLDSGATISVVNEDVAKECGIVKTKQQIPIMGLDQVATPYSLSTDTAVRVGQHAYATLQFAISPKKECPTLLSLGAMEELGLAVDYKKREAKVNGHAVHCFVAEKETEIPNVIQQTAYGSLQQTVEQESKTWTVEMTTTERAQAVNLLTEFADLWHQPQIGRCTTVEMEIKVEGKPKRIKARPTPIHLKGEMDRQVNDLLAAGVIRPDPDCEWVSPCHLVRKPRSDKWRLVTDYRYVNTLVQDDSYQIPAATDLIIRLTGAKTFTLIDLNWGFWNIRLKPESQPFTGFVVPEKGVYVWRVMPFGIKVSPTIFQRAVEKALRNVLDKGYVSVYIDDIVIYTETVSQHLQVLRETLQSLREGGFYINFLKCSFLRKEILYLGHIVSANTVKPDPKKVKALVDAQAPKDKKALKSFCAAASYLRSYIQNFAEVIEPLTRMSSQYVRFKWEDEQQEAFEKIKTDMINATYLTMPSWTKPFIIFADASEVAVGSVLAQIADDDESFNFIAFASKKFSDQQKNWSATEKELYAIVWSCERFDGFIKGQPILIYTDHKSLENLTSIDSPKTRRWAIRLSEYRPHVTHIGGDVNILADWLSRSVGDDIDVPDYIYVPECYHVVHELASQFRLPDPQSFIVEAQKEVASLPTGTCMIEEGGTVRGIKSKKLFIPTVYREQILRWFHASRFGGHQGIHRTYNKLKKYVWWPKMFSTVQSFVSSCPICNAIKPIRKQSGEKDVFKRAQLFEIVALDHIGPRRYQDVSYYILVMIDHYSRFMVAVTSTSCSAQTTLDDFKLHWIAKFGVPKIILTDHGTAFTSTIFRDYVLKELRTQHIMSSIEYPQGNAINESSHRLLEVAIRASPVSSKLPFHELVMDATLLHNATPHSMLGDTPSSLMFGVDLRIPGLQQYEDQVEESARLATMSTYRGIRALQNQLKELQKMAEQNQISTIGPRAYLVGDIVIYALGATEASRASHHSGAIKYAAVNSFPHRVLKVLPHNLEVQPIWTEGASRVVPTTQCRLIASFKPDLLREDAAQLFPGLPWISTVPTSSTVPAPVVLPREALLPAEDEEMVPVEPPQRRSKRQRRQTDRGPVLG